MRGGRAFSKQVKRLAWHSCNGICAGCGKKLQAGDIHYDHVVPWAMTSDSSINNCQVLCEACHDAKTARSDMPNIAKAKRAADFHHGISGPGQGRAPLPCGKRSARSKTFRRGIVPRISQSERHRQLMAERYPEWHL